MAIDRLINKINNLQAPIVVGLDPQLNLIPDNIKERFFKYVGKNPTVTADMFKMFNGVIIDNICDIVPCVKLQIAMYEMLGTPGIEAYIQTVEYAKQKGMIVIGDVKRGDIALTATAYSRAHIGEVDIEGKKHEVFGTDFVTINPFMGYDTMAPFIEDCDLHDKGLFVLVKTSNPSSGDIQDIVTKDNKPLYEHVGNLVQTWGKEAMGSQGFSKVGAVVGATYANEAKTLRSLMPNTFFLVPGFGAQGATTKDIVPFFINGGGAIVNSSRGILGAYRQDKYKHFGEDGYGSAARAAALDMIKEITAVIHDHK